MLANEIIKREKQYLQSLVDNGQIETKKLEVKSGLPGTKREEKIEFLADVSSFANTIGGELIYGVLQDKNTGKLDKVKGIEVENVDEEVQRLESMIRDGLQPRIPVKEIFPIPWENSKIVLIIRIPKSMIGPHRVISGGHDKFYARNSNGKYPMDVDELRISFNFSQSIKEKIKNFHLDRIAQLRANVTPVPFYEGPKLIMHFIPLNSFLSLEEYDLSYYYRHPEQLHPVRAHAWHSQYNLDGIISFYRPSGDAESHTYVQLYRDGIIETVTILNGSEKNFYISRLERELVNDLNYYLNVQKKIGVQPDIFFFLTLSGVKGFKIPSAPFESFPGEIHEIDRDVLDLPEVVVSQFDINSGKFLRSLFNLLWNACGYPESPNYDREGNWKLESRFG